MALDFVPEGGRKAGNGGPVEDGDLDFARLDRVGGPLAAAVPPPDPCSVA